MLLALAGIGCTRAQHPAAETTAPAAAAARSGAESLAAAATKTELPAAATQASAADPAQPSAETLAMRAAIERIGEAAVYSPEAENQAAAALRHPDQDVRGHACWALGRMAPQTAAQIGNLIAALADPVWSVQHNAGWALVRFGAQAVPALQAALGNGGPGVRARAALATFLGLSSTTSPRRSRARSTGTAGSRA